MEKYSWVQWRLHCHQLITESKEPVQVLHSAIVTVRSQQPLNCHWRHPWHSDERQQTETADMVACNRYNERIVWADAMVWIASWINNGIEKIHCWNLTAGSLNSWRYMDWLDLIAQIDHWHCRDYEASLPHNNRSNRCTKMTPNHVTTNQTVFLQLDQT